MLTSNQTTAICGMRLARRLFLPSRNGASSKEWTDANGLSETDDLAAQEDVSNPRRLQYVNFLAIVGTSDAAECHGSCSSEVNSSEKNSEDLQDVRGGRGRPAIAEYAPNVASDSRKA
jgi:hypothetical protein